MSDTTLEDVFLKITIQDIEASPESFHALDGKCKRRAMEMIRKFRDQVKRKKDMPSLPESVADGARPPIVTIVVDPTMPTIEASHIRSNGSVAPSVLLSQASLSQVDIDGNLLACSDENGTNSANSANTSLLEENMFADEFPVKSSDKNYSPCCLACIQIRTIFLKRLWNSNRNRKAMFFEVLLIII